MERVLVICAGISPLLMNPASKELLLQVRSKTTPPRQPDLAPREEARKKLGWGDDYGMAGVVGIPSTNLFACLKNAGRKVKIGRSQISTASTTTLPAYLSIEDEFLALLDDDGHPLADETLESAWEEDIRRGKNPNGGEMVVLIRPKFKSWRFGAHLLFDEKSMNESVAKQLFDIAGAMYGLGDFRPGTGGQFGRFGIESWMKLDGSSNGHVAVPKPELAAALA